MFELLTIRSLAALFRHYDTKRMRDFTFPENVSLISDIRYKEGNNPYHLMDVRFPAGIKGRLPVVIDIHGGGLFYGDKNLNRYYDAEIAGKGFAVFSVSYRLVPKVKLHEQVDDVINALSFINNNLSKYNGDAGKVYLTGDSAGAFLAALAVQVMRNEELAAAFKTKTVDMQVKAVSLTHGMMSIDSPHKILKKINRLAVGKNPLEVPYYKYLDFVSMPNMKDFPPAYISSSEEDEISPYSFRFAEKLSQFGIPHIHRHLKKQEGVTLQHIFQVAFPKEKNSQAVIDEMLKFFLDQK